MRKLLTGTGIDERALLDSPAARDQLWGDVPTTPRGWPKSGVMARAGGRRPAGSALAACMT